MTNKIVFSACLVATCIVPVDVIAQHTTLYDSMALAGRPCRDLAIAREPLQRIVSGWNNLLPAETKQLSQIKSSGVAIALESVRTFVRQRDSTWLTTTDSAYAKKGFFGRITGDARTPVPLDTALVTEAIVSSFIATAVRQCDADDGEITLRIYLKPAAQGFPNAPTIEFDPRPDTKTIEPATTAYIAALIEPQTIVLLDKRLTQRQQRAQAEQQERQDSLVSEERTKASAATVRSIVTIFSALIVLCALIGGGWLLIRRAKARKSQSKPVRSVAWSETEDIHEPVEVYRQHLKDRHAINTKRYFEELVERSGINEEKNRKTVKALRRLELTFASVVKTRFWWKASRLASVGAAVIFGFLGLNNPWFFAGTAIIALIVLSQLNPKIREISAQADDFEKRIKTTTQEAWSQMAPLNRLYGWPILSDLFQQTVPRIVLDTYLTQARINELQSEFKWNASLGDDTSIVFAHSGALNGNPFILARTLDHWMGTKTYHGSLRIQWTERVKSSNGRYQTVQRSETLHASVTKPFPEYTSRTHIFYGNEAAPDLTFSRKPTPTSKSKTGAVGGFLRWFKLKRLESKSRKATSTKSFTLMSNNEFEVLFDASNRNHEVQFRLLFTAMAQQEMIALIRDRDVGYGDTFIFHKDKMMNVISASHMDEHDISGDPRLFHNYDIDEARSFFNDYHNTFFRSFFFALSPLLSIPLYQQHRSHLDIYRDSVGRRAAEWEHESIANYLGEEAFMHPACITRNILKTKEERSDDGMSRVEVTAAGFRGVERRDFVEKRGGDGRSHMVPVDWIEYFEVSNSTEVWVHDASTTRQSSEDLESIWTQAYAQRGIDSAKINVRRGIAMSLG